MQFYMAPMEGITGYVFRNAYQKNFGGIDRYFTPFITNKKMNYKELNDIAPEHNRGMQVIPQILTNRADDFCEIARELEQYGYGIVNLNLGCPSGTVAAKKRGAGFLSEPDALDRFLEEIFKKCPLQISIKTRIGIEEDTEWERLLTIYNRYPLEELIVHPRVLKDFYRNTPRVEAYLLARKHCSYPVCYNGDIHSMEAYKSLCEKAGEVERLMLGRGLLQNPGLIREIRGEEKLTKEKLKQFHDDVLEGYLAVMSGDRNTLFKMKELWAYLGKQFVEPEKYLKKIKKVTSVAEYRVIADTIFDELKFVVAY